MRWVLPLIVFILVLVGAAIWQMPLAFALNRIDTRATGLQWQHVHGTIWHGQITGLRLGAQEMGNAELKLKPGSLLSGQLAYDVNWNGPPGRGAGEVRIGKTSFGVTNLRSEIDVRAINGLSNQVRQVGGTLRLRADEIAFEDNRCKTATGTLTTDTLTRAASAYGRDWPDLAGDLACEDGMLSIPLDASASSGEVISVRAKAGLIAPSSLEARVTGADVELETTLALLGFSLENGSYVYRREAGLP